MKSIESQAEEYAEALNDIADVLGMPTGSTSSQIAEAVESRWAAGIHSCGDNCKRTACVLRRERDGYKSALDNLASAICQYGGGASMMHPRLTRAISAARKIIQENDQVEARRK